MKRGTKKYIWLQTAWKNASLWKSGVSLSIIHIYGCCTKPDKMLALLKVWLDNRLFLITLPLNCINNICLNYPIDIEYVVLFFLIYMNFWSTEIRSVFVQNLINRTSRFIFMLLSLSISISYLYFANNRRWMTHYLSNLCLGVVNRFNLSIMLLFNECMKYNVKHFTFFQWMNIHQGRYNYLYI